MKKLVYIIIPLLIIGLGLSINILRADEENTSTKDQLPRQVDVATAQQIAHREQIFAVGQLSSSEEVKLSFKTGGIVGKILVSEGQKVRRGQLLAELQLDEIEAQVEQSVLGIQQSKITIDNARLMLNKAERDFRNVQGLYADSVATLDQLEDAKLQLNNARNQLQAAETGLSFSQRTADIAQFNRDHSRIVAPANGEILLKMGEANELIGPGQPLFLFGSKDKAQIIRVNVTDKEVIHLALGAVATVGFDAYPQMDFRGTVREIANIADPYTGTYAVEVEIDAAGKKLLSGFVGQVYIAAEQELSLVSIPVDALVSAEKNRGVVFVVEGEKAIKKTVDIYQIEGENLLLRDGLAAGKVVVVKGAGYLEDESLVSVK